MDISVKIKKNVELAPLTTFKIGGAAKYYSDILSKEELSAALVWAREHKQKVFILGGGSNVLVNDAGIDGLVLRIKNTGSAVKGERLEMGAGALLSVAVAAATAHELSGLEWAAGIPGTIGGAIRGNAGAFGAKMSDCVETAEYYDMAKDRFGLFSRNDCAFIYRGSRFKEEPSLVIWSATCKLSPGKKEDITRAINDHILQRRQSQPCLPSAGCVFKNFRIEELEAANPGLAREARDSGAVKGGMVGAGWVIDRADLRGRKIGQVKVSLEHANFIVNTGQASAQEVVMMASFIKQQVRDQLGLQLSEELEYFG